MPPYYHYPEGQGMIKIEPTIDKILWGKSLVEVKDSHNTPHLFILRSLTIKEANMVQYIYDKEYEHAINNGVLQLEDLQELYRESGVWTDEDENNIALLKAKIPYLKNRIKALEFFTSKRRQVERLLKQTQQELQEKINNKNSLFTITAENRAEEFKRRYVVMMSSETQEEKRYWPSVDEFLDERDFILIYNLAIAYYENNIFDEKTVRKIARSGSWRFRWAAAKNGTDLFGKPISEWSEMQKMLIYWSQYYDYVFDSSDTPPDSIIENDASCDAWVEEQSKKNKPKGDGKRNILGTKKATMQKDHQEQFIMVAPGDKEAIKKVQNMNPATIRQKLKREHQQIKAKGKVTEWNLRKGEYVK